MDSVDSDATRAAIRSVCQPWNTSTLWAPGGNGVDKWLAAKLPENTLVESYMVASTAATCPLSWKLQGSLDGSTWADLHVVENTGVWGTAREEKVFTIPEEGRGSYLWYRLYVTASNAAAMSISTFRLLRAQSVCGKGQLRLDASAASPLVLSFMNGFASDGITPVDDMETLSAATVYGFEDMNCNIPQVITDGFAHCDIVAQKYGGYALSLEACNTSNALFNNQGMRGNVDRGFTVTNYDGTEAPSYAHQAFFKTGSVDIPHGTSLNLKVCRSTASLFYINELSVANGSHNGISVIEENGTLQTIFSPDNYGTAKVARLIYGVCSKVSYANWKFRNTSLQATSFCSPYKYRVSVGKLFQMGLSDSDWSPVQKIKLGTCDIYNGDVVNLDIRSAQSMQWQTDGNYLSTI